MSRKRNYLWISLLAASQLAVISLTGCGTENETAAASVEYEHMAGLDRTIKAEIDFSTAGYITGNDSESGTPASQTEEESRQQGSSQSLDVTSADPSRGSDSQENSEGPEPEGNHR